jgi:hypothetical protein
VLSQFGTEVNNEDKLMRSRNLGMAIALLAGMGSIGPAVKLPKEEELGMPFAPLYFGRPPSKTYNGGKRSGAAQHKRAAKKLRNIRARSSKRA